MAEPNGFYYMRARYYDPKVGRFVSEDPLGFGGGDVNLMAYVGNNPVNALDPWGKASIDLKDAYVDINVTVSKGYALTLGAMMQDGPLVYPYFGVGLASPGTSATVTVSSSQPTPGLNIALTGATKGIATQAGLGPDGVAYGEVGVAIPFKTSFALTGFYVFEPINVSKYISPAKDYVLDLNVQPCHGR